MAPDHLGVVAAHARRVAVHDDRAPSRQRRPDIVDVQVVVGEAGLAVNALGADEVAGEAAQALRVAV